jgi:hypothetical protein
MLDHRRVDRSAMRVILVRLRRRASSLVWS